MNYSFSVHRGRTDHRCFYICGLFAIEFARLFTGTGITVNALRPGVLAPFAVDQAADLCSCGHENDDSAAGLVCMSWTAPGTRTTATWNA